VTRVVVLSEAAAPGSAPARSLAALLASLARAGVAGEASVEEAPPPRRLAPLRRRADRAFARGLAARSAGAAAVHARGPRATALALAARDASGVPVVAQVDEDRAASRRRSRGAPDRPETPPDAAEAALTARADAALYATRTLAARFPPRDGAPRAVAAPAPAPPDDAAAERLREERRRESRLAGGEWVVGAALDPADPAHEAARLVAILAHAMERVPQMRAWLLAPEPARVRALVDAARIPPGRVVARPLAEGDVVTALLVADAGVVLRRPSLASAVEWPLEVAESLAAGLRTVVAAAAPEAADLVERDETLGHVTAWKKDDASWAARLAGAARPQGPEERAARRAFARRRLVARLDEALVALYAGLSRAPPAPS
jgi:hypothetical protein